MTSPTTDIESQRLEPTAGMRESDGETHGFHSRKEWPDSRCCLWKRGNDSLPTEILHSRERHGDYAGKISGRSAACSQAGWLPGARRYYFGQSAAKNPPGGESGS